MSMTKLNRYVGKWAPSTILEVDAPDLTTAVNTMIANKGCEPNIVQLTAENVLGVITSEQIEFTVNITPSNSGVVYPNSNTSEVNQDVLFTAVPSTGYVFDHFEYYDEIYNEAISKIKMTKSGTINAVFKVDEQLLNSCKIWINNDNVTPTSLPDDAFEKIFKDGKLSFTRDLNNQYLIIAYSELLPELSSITIGDTDVLDDFTVSINEGTRYYVSNELTSTDSKFTLELGVIDD